LSFDADCTFALLTIAAVVFHSVISKTQALVHVTWPCNLDRDHKVNVPAQIGGR
jgi:hypothetical protein